MSVELSNYGKVGDDQSAEPSSVSGALLQYWSKFKGVEGKTFPPQNSYIEMNVSFLLSFVGILMLSALDRWFLIRFFTYDEGDQFTVTMLTAAYAASAVLLFDAPTSPLAQPWNCILGHTISALLGVLIRMAGFSVGAEVWVIAPIAVAASIFLMNVLECTHPPAAGTAMIATVGGPKIWALGFGFILTNFGASSLFVCWACIGNNLSRNRQYPLYWYKSQNTLCSSNIIAAPIIASTNSDNNSLDKDNKNSNDNFQEKGSTHEGTSSQAESDANRI